MAESLVDDHARGARVADALVLPRRDGFALQQVQGGADGLSGPLPRLLEHLRPAETAEGAEGAFHLLPPGGHGGDHGGHIGNRLVQVPVFREEELAEGAVAGPHLHIQHPPVDSHGIFADGVQLLEDGLVPHVRGVAAALGGLPELRGLVAGQGGGQGGDVPQGLRLLPQALGQGGADIGDVGLGKLVEGVLRAPRVVEHPDHKAAPSAHAGGGDAGAAPADAP